MKNLKLKPIAIAAIAVIVILAGVVAFLVPSSRAATDPKASSPKPALTVTTARPLLASLPIKLSASGNVTAWQEAIIGSESSGLRLAEVRANVGDAVHAGQVLALFAADSIHADVAQARAGLMEAEANAADAAGNAERARTLEKTGALSAQQINQYLTSAQTARARVEAAKATLAAQQVRLKNAEVRAPDSGVISARTATVGAVAAAGGELFRMIRQGRLEWRAEVTSAELGRLPAGTLVVVTAANGTQIKGKVRMIAPTVDPQTRAALVYVDLPVAADKNAPVKAGMFAKGEFELGNSNALTVPQQAVVVRDGFSYVFMLNADSRVSQVKIQTGRRLADRVEVIDGLKPDALLVVSGAGFLNDGDLVRNVPASADGASNASEVAADSVADLPIRLKHSQVLAFIPATLNSPLAVAQLAAK